MTDPAARWWLEQEAERDRLMDERRYDEEGEERDRRLDREEGRSCVVRGLKPWGPLPPSGSDEAWAAERAAIKARRSA